MKEKTLHEGLKPFLTCKDFLVSNESYEVLHNSKYDMLVTSPIPSDIEKYYESEDYISHQGKKRNLLDYVYGFVKKRAIKNKHKIIVTTASEKSVLDIGAGTGDFLVYCKSKNWNVFGVEPNKKAQNIAKQKEINLETDLDDIQQNKFQAITMWHVLEHVPNLFDYLERIKTLLDSDGKLIVAVPNFKSYDAQYYKEFWAAYDVPRHLWHFSQESIHKIFESLQMKVVETKPMVYDSFYISLMSEKYKHQKMKPIAAFWHGLLSNLKAKRTSEYSSLIYVIKHA